MREESVWNIVFKRSRILQHSPLSFLYFWKCSEHYIKRLSIDFSGNIAKVILLFTTLISLKAMLKKLKKNDRSIAIPYLLLL